MKSRNLFSPFLFLAIASLGSWQIVAAKPVETAQAVSFESKDSAFDKLLAPGANLEVLKRGIGWGEGIGWDKKNGCVYFTDVAKAGIFRWKDGKGISKLQGLGGKDSIKYEADGLIVDKTGHILIGGHRNRCVSRLENNFTLTIVADKFKDKRFNSPNDLVLDAQDNLYFTDPPYGLKGKNDSTEKELKFNGVFRLSPSGELKLLTKDLTWPNGIALSPDEKTLYVSVSDQKKPVVMAYDLGASGISHGRVFFDCAGFASDKKGLPNGVKTDKDGNVFLAGPGGIFVLDAQGKHLGTIMVANYTMNLTWGDDGATLYITTAHTLCRLRMNTKGTGF